MEESSDCTLIVKENHTDFHGTVFDDKIDSTATRLVKIDALRPKIPDTCTAGDRTIVENVIVFNDDRVVLLISFADDRWKMLQLFSREFDYLSEVDVHGETRDVFQSDNDTLALVLETFPPIHFCSVKGDVLKILWNINDNNFNPSGQPHGYSLQPSNHIVYNGDMYARICKAYNKHSAMYGYFEKEVVEIYRNTFDHIVHTDVPESPPYSHAAIPCPAYSQHPEDFLLKCVDDVGFLALHDNNSRFYHLSWPRRIKCISYFGFPLWTVDDMGTGLGLDNSLLLGMEKVGNKLCCYLGDGVLVIDIMTKKITAVKMENESDFETISKYVTRNRARYEQTQNKYNRFLPAVPKTSIAVQYKGHRILVSNGNGVDVYSLRPY